MGAKVLNIQMIVDYTTGTQFFRLHVDIPLSPRQATEIRGLMEKGELEKVKRKLRPLVDPSAKKLIDALSAGK